MDDLYPGETLGIFGESGCGKSTLGRLLVALEQPTAGTITSEGRDVTHFKGSEMRKLRRDIQIVFQDPYTSLDPRMAVGDIVSEPFRTHPEAVSRSKRTERVKELLDLVGPGTHQPLSARVFWWSAAAHWYRSRNCSAAQGAGMRPVFTR